ncbi:YcdB/YcdC domain-containing protein [Bacillus dakarensis]|uniref:YcdB/YcdC domain-containing protein n=1 Tax=Robertmurraya dakarensis TaxID=1926278 RepID=UPI0009FDDC5B|nr:YcdB/YcdC domain-containing protein [Bacillus dakarensis]
MRNFKKTSMLALSTVMSFGILAPAVSAAPFNAQQQEVQFRIAKADTVVTKSELIERFRGIFPDFDFLNEGDFHMSSGHTYPDDDSIRYELDFHKNLNGHQVYGGVGFVGENLELERFYYEPIRTADSLFPPKVTREEAEKAARAFLEQFAEGEDYKLNADTYYYSGNQTLTDPIRYSFSFVSTKNQIPLSDQFVQISVLGNGEIVEYYRNLNNHGPQTYDDIKKVQSEQEILAKVKDNLAIQLRYRLNYDYRSDERSVDLVYQPTGQFYGVHALSGEWQNASGFTADLPVAKEIIRVANKPLQPKEKNFTLEKVKAQAEELLAIDHDNINLSIQSIDERQNYNGQEVINIQYMYEYQNGGYGSDLEFDKETGEIIQYHDLKHEVLKEIGEESASGKPLSREKALERAVDYLKAYAPSYLHHYSMPLEDSYFESDRGIYYFTFPRVVNDIVVNGDQISVTVAEDGSLLGLNVGYQDVENWPSSEDIISEEKAMELYSKALGLELQYVKEGNGKKDHHYHLVYQLVFNENSFSFLDAITGDWKSIEQDAADSPVVSHPWAEEELNFLIQAGILEVDDAGEFKGDAPVTKGEGIEVIMKSLTRFYEGYYPERENDSQTFDNIGPDHPLYQVVERAATMEILDTGNKSFNFEAPLTREELAVWYIRALGLESAAEHHKIYKLEFADARDVDYRNVGYVAIANAIGVLTADENKFRPDDKVTYADLAVSTFRLAREVYERGSEFRY